jgi:hypothetical protein
MPGPLAWLYAVTICGLLALILSACAPALDTSSRLAPLTSIHPMPRPEVRP